MFMRRKLIHGGLKSTRLGTEHHKETLWESGSVSYVCHNMIVPVTCLFRFNNCTLNICAFRFQPSFVSIKIKAKKNTFYYVNQGSFIFLLVCVLCVCAMYKDAFTPVGMYRV